MPSFYQLSPEETLQQLNSSVSGQTGASARALQAKFGKNVLNVAKKKSKLGILISQFRDVMILILIAAAAISFIAGEPTDACVILAIILGNAWIGYRQEYQAEEALRMLQQLSTPHTVVLRDQRPVEISSADIVPGDILLLEAGDLVPADARILELSSLKTDEASLTGESRSIDKQSEALAKGDLVPGDQLNMLFRGTAISNGSVKAVVTATGMRTELGRIAGMLESPRPRTPLQKRLAVFSRQLAIIVILICLAVFGFGLWRGESPFDRFLTALSLAVAALPEALPAVTTIALALGARSMVKQKALMRRLPAMETLGSVTCICSDKTGTLTQNRMRVEHVEASPGQEELLHIAMLLNNEVRLSGKQDLLGDSTETALVRYAREQGSDKAEAEEKFPLLEKLPFDSDRMRMSTLHQYGDHLILLVKGAPAKITEALSRKYERQVAGWLDQNRKWAAEGLRVLFFGYRILEEKPGKLKTDIEQELDFLGMVAMIDPPRPEAVEALKTCKSAGIHTVMITGDQVLTATAIARRLGMMEAGSETAQTGTDLEKLSEAELRKVVRNTPVYARVSPEQKLNIIRSLQANGAFVAMTGDGVNDAPSLKQADIGIAMGITGTDVSKEAADMILLDDNFATIVKAIREGRRIYENIKKFILYVLSCNLGEILTILLAPLLGFAMPLLPIHILWINLVTDGLPGVALVGEAPEKDIMNRPPRPPKESLFAGGMIRRILTTCMVLVLAALSIQAWTASRGYGPDIQQTAVFTTLCWVQLGNALSVRSARHSFFGGLPANRALWGAIALSVLLQLLIVYLPLLQGIFKTSSLGWDIMVPILLIFSLSLLCLELLKYLSGKRKAE